MNNYQREISNMFDTATSSIQVAVPWFTDDVLIEKLIQKAGKVKVELLLSGDKTNVLKHQYFKRLQNAGATVQKVGANQVFGENPFMHSKVVIIDKQKAWGGSYNFTDNAKSNYELFDEYKQVTKSLQSFSGWFSESCDLFRGWDNPEKMIEEVREEFAATEYKRKNYQNQLISAIENHKHSLVAEEIKKGNLREVTQSIAKQETKIASNGTTTTSSGVSSPTHRNYGGLFLGDFNGKKQANCYGIAYYQKLFIEKHYSFLKCRIENDTLICVGEVQPDHCEKYKIRIEFRAGHHPQVFVTSPTILQSPDIHVYSNGSLCLFYPPDMKWKDSTKIAAYTIPWTIEWIMLYELWKLTGKWEAAEVLHRRS
jgi:hypothetical protein